MFKSVTLATLPDSSHKNETRLIRDSNNLFGWRGLNDARIKTLVNNQSREGGICTTKVGNGGGRWGGGWWYLDQGEDVIEGHRSG
jgi:hypothetical protein